MITRHHIYNYPWKGGYKAYPDSCDPPYKRYQLDKPCMIAIDALSSAIIRHPKLAKQIPLSHREFFVTDQEHNRWYLN